MELISNAPLNPQHLDLCQTALSEASLASMWFKPIEDLAHSAKRMNSPVTYRQRLLAVEPSRLVPISLHGLNLTMKNVDTSRSSLFKNEAENHLLMPSKEAWPSVFLGPSSGWQKLSKE